MPTLFAVPGRGADEHASVLPAHECGFVPVYDGDFIRVHFHERFEARGFADAAGSGDQECAVPPAKGPGVKEAGSMGHEPLGDRDAEEAVLHEGGELLSGGEPPHELIGLAAPLPYGVLVSFLQTETVCMKISSCLLEGQGDRKISVSKVDGKIVHIKSF